MFLGHYKVRGRVYTIKNETVADVEGTGYIKPNHANRAGDFSMLNMG